jgi:hypothetical protein
VIGVRIPMELYVAVTEEASRRKMTVSDLLLIRADLVGLVRESMGQGGKVSGNGLKRPSVIEYEMPDRSGDVWKLKDRFEGNKVPKYLDEWHESMYPGDKKRGKKYRRMVNDLRIVFDGSRYYEVFQEAKDTRKFPSEIPRDNLR